jgi:hypothetical protein
VADAYLNVAEQVLLSSRRPLRPREIINTAYANELLPWHLHGLTQDKTLHARISEDVAGNPTLSRFFRTGPGVFFLRSLLDDESIPSAFKQPYFAPPRRRELRRERILCLDRLGGRVGASTDPFVNIASLKREFADGHYRFITPYELDRQSEGVAVHSFVLVFHGETVLSYRCGKFFPDDAPLKGKRSIGLGGAVYASDRDMLFNDMYGIIASGINELGYGIGLSKFLSERARYEGLVKPSVGVLLPASASRSPVLHVVLAYECPPDFLPSKAALSVNDLRWLEIGNPANTLDGFDVTSALLFETGRVTKIREMVRAHAPSV